MVFPGALGLIDPIAWQGVAPRLAQDHRRADCHRELSAAVSSLDAWEGAMTVMPGLDIPERMIAVVPEIPFAQMMMTLAGHPILPPGFVGTGGGGAIGWAAGVAGQESRLEGWEGGLFEV